MSLRSELDDLLLLDLSLLTAQDARSLAPLQGITLDSLNWFDAEIDVHGFLQDVEILGNQFDQLDAITWEINELESFLQTNAPSYFVTYTDAIDGIQTRWDAVFASSVPSLGDFLGANFGTLWGSLTGITSSLYNAVIASVGGLSQGIADANAEIVGLSKAVFGTYALNLGANTVQTVEITQFFYQVAQSIGTVIDKVPDLFEANTRDAAGTALSGQLTVLLKEWEDFQIVNGGLPFNGPLLKVAQVMLATKRLLDNIDDTAALESASQDDGLTGRSREFLDDAAFIGVMERGDILTDYLSIAADFMTLPGTGGVPTFLLGMADTLINTLSLNEKSDWQIRVDQFASYSALNPIISDYQVILQQALTQADVLSTGLWGTDLEAVASGTVSGDTAQEQGATLSIGATLSGTLNSGLDEDYVSLALMAGQGYRFEFNATGSNFGYIHLLDSTGELFASYDIAPSSYGVSVLEGTVRDAGTYYLLIEGSTGGYTLSATSVTLPDDWTELEDANADTNTTHVMTVGETFAGELSQNNGQEDGADWIAIDLIAGQDLRFTVTDQDTGFKYIALRDQYGTQIASYDVTAYVYGTATLEGTVQESGRYFLDISGSSGAYQISAETLSTADTITEMLDAGEGVATRYALDAGESFRGVLNGGGEGDWVRVSLQEGHSYQFDVEALGTGFIELSLYDRWGDLVAAHEGVNAVYGEASLRGTALQSGDYFLAVTGSPDQYRVTSALATSVYDVEELVDAAASVETIYSIALGAQFQGTMNTNVSNGPDREDWVAVTLEAGRAYLMTQRALGTGLANLELYDGSGTRIATETSGLSDYDTSVIAFTATVGGTYYLGATGSPGDYTLGYALDITKQTGGAQDDRLTGSAASDLVRGGAGNDEILTRAGQDTLSGGLGRDLLDGGAGEDSADYSGAGGSVKVLLGAGKSRGADGRDQLINIENATGSDFADRLTGSDGDNVLRGLGGNDILRSGEGNNRLEGGGGDDRIFGKTGDDIVFGDAGDDLVKSSAGADEVNGGIGNDVIYLGQGDDLARGDLGDDRLFGNAGEDRLEGGLGNDRLFGGSNADLLLGGGGDDILCGENGDDILIGGAGDDNLFGGAGADHFVFYGGLTGLDRIKDFTAGEDLLDLRGLGIETFAQVSAMATDLGSGDLRLLLEGNGNIIRIEQVMLAELDAGDFWFA